MGIPDFYTSDAVAETLGIHPVTFAQWRARGKGPQHVKINGAIRYTAAAVLDWIRDQNPDVDMTLIIPALEKGPATELTEQE